jgi:hypothetical protein
MKVQFEIVNGIPYANVEGSTLAVFVHYSHDTSPAAIDLWLKQNMEGAVWEERSYEGGDNDPGTLVPANLPEPMIEQFGAIITEDFVEGDLDTDLNLDEYPYITVNHLNEFALCISFGEELHEVMGVCEDCHEVEDGCKCHEGEDD